VPRDLLDHREPGPAWRTFQRNLAKCRAHYDCDDMIAARLGRNVRWLRRVTAGDTAPHIDDIWELAKAFGVDPGDLAFGYIEEKKLRRELTPISSGQS